jgi:hypothetical protein
MTELDKLKESLELTYEQYIAFPDNLLYSRWLDAKEAFEERLKGDTQTVLKEMPDSLGPGSIVRTSTTYHPVSKPLRYNTDGIAYHPVSKPAHYNNTDGGVECITYIKQVLGKDGFVAYCRGNVMKYNHRAMYKGNPLEDMAKAQQYLEWANETLKEIHK